MEDTAEMVDKDAREGGKWEMCCVDVNDLGVGAFERGELGELELLGVEWCLLRYGCGGACRAKRSLITYPSARRSRTPLGSA